MQKYGQRLKEYRKMKNITQKEAAEMLQMPQGNYSRLEKGEQDIKLSMIEHICETFDMSIEWFLGYTDITDENKAYNLFYKDVCELIFEYEKTYEISISLSDEILEEISKLKRKHFLE